LAELATGIVFTLIYWHLGFNLLEYFTGYEIWNLLYLWIAFSLLAIAFIYDAKHYIIPDKITFSGIVISIVWLAFSFFNGSMDGATLLGSIYAAFLSSLFFFFLWLFSRGKAMGFGDVKLVFFLGLLLGFPKMVVALFFAFTVGAGIGLLLISSGGKKMRSQVPFGPFLIAGALFALLYGTQTIDWYWSLGVR
jgi:prepilin signal peptidase PulO-like enzyme (type II secretory pathway)